MDLARHWRLRQQRYRLEGGRCENCGTTLFPVRPVCPQCRSRQVQRIPLSGRGELYSFTTLYHAPAAFASQLPYTVGLVRLAEGPLITAQITDVDPDELYIGMPLEMVTRKLSSHGEEGLIVYGYKFRPPLEDPEHGEVQDEEATARRNGRYHGTLAELQPVLVEPPARGR